MFKTSSMSAFYCCYSTAESDTDINPICTKHILLNTGVHKQENEWSFVKLFHTVPELKNFTFSLPWNLAHKFWPDHELSTAIFYHL